MINEVVKEVPVDRVVVRNREVPVDRVVETIVVRVRLARPPPPPPPPTHPTPHFLWPSLE